MLLENIVNAKIIDLTHELAENIPIWPGIVPFQHKMLEDYSYEGYRTFSFTQSEGVGTHMDSPKHFQPGGRGIADLKITDLIAPVCVIDVREQVKLNPNYRISVQDLENWEAKHGGITKRSIVLGFTGWSQYWDDVQKYLNQDANGTMHFPGWGKEAATLLVARGIVGIGIDTISIDAGEEHTFASHHVLLGNNVYIIENLTNLAKLPSSGALVIALPLKIKDGVESPIRAIALVS